MNESGASNLPKLNHAPAGYHTIQPYLMFEDAAAAIQFFNRIFGATERLCMKNQDGRIAHAEMQIGDCILMMADQNSGIGAFAAAHYGGSPISIMIYVEHCDTTYARALEAGATSLREPADQPYGDRMAGIVDPFGYKWWIAHSLAPAPIAEVEVTS